MVVSEVFNPPPPLSPWATTGPTARRVGHRSSWPKSSPKHPRILHQNGPDVLSVLRTTALLLLRWRTLLLRRGEQRKRVVICDSPDGSRQSPEAYSQPNPRLDKHDELIIMGTGFATGGILQIGNPSCH